MEASFDYINNRRLWEVLGNSVLTDPTSYTLSQTISFPTDDDLIHFIRHIKMYIDLWGSIGEGQFWIVAQQEHALSNTIRVWHKMPCLYSRNVRFSINAARPHTIDIWLSKFNRGWET